MIEIVISQRRRDLGGFEVGRVLPFAKRRVVGPFVFFDHMGPVDFPAGLPRSVDVRPHPHIGLSTLTYLFEGEIMHRDSVGSEQPIRPGEVNWMTAGRGITHSERFERARREGGRMDGIQAWVALPREVEETDPAFSHHRAVPLRAAARRERRAAGSVCGACRVCASGAVAVDGQRFEAGQMVVFGAGAASPIRATSAAVLMLLGGEPLGQRFIEWNFVSSSRERIEQAKADWRAGRMKLPDLDNGEFIPLPV